MDILIFNYLIMYLELIKISGEHKLCALNTEIASNQLDLIYLFAFCQPNLLHLFDFLRQPDLY
jgi:hypothetical protein